MHSGCTGRLQMSVPISQQRMNDSFLELKRLSNRLQDDSPHQNLIGCRAPSVWGKTVGFRLSSQQPELGWLQPITNYVWEQCNTGILGTTNQNGQPRTVMGPFCLAITIVTRWLDHLYYSLCLLNIREASLNSSIWGCNQNWDVNIVEMLSQQIENIYACDETWHNGMQNCSMQKLPGKPTQ